MAPDPVLLSFLRLVIRQQCHMGLLAADDLERAIEGSMQARTQGPEPVFEPDALSPEELYEHGLAMGRHFDLVEHWRHRIWGSTRGVLIAAANVGKVLFPLQSRRTKKLTPTRGDDIRARLGVLEDSPLANRDLRDAFEHFDEKVEQWWLDADGGLYYDGLIVETAVSPDEDIGAALGENVGGMVFQLRGRTTRDAMRVFALHRRSVIQYGTEYRLTPLIDEMKRLMHDAS